MLFLKNILWWLVFICFAVILQRIVPGLDALIVGIMLASEEKAYKTLAWLVPLTLLLQEGMGSQYFGESLIYVCAFFVLLRLTRSLSLTAPSFCTFLISLGMGLLRVLLDCLFSALQNIPFNLQDAAADGLIQAGYILMSWTIFSRLRLTLLHENTQRNA